MTGSADMLWSHRLGPAPAAVRVVIEVPRGGFIKRTPDGAVDFVSPFPCPYNYGSVLDTQSPDGDPVDAVVLGPRLEPGTEVDTQVRAAIGFVDDGVFDPKIVCAPQPLTGAQRRKVARFFRVYAVFKRGVNAMRQSPGRMAGRTLCTGWLPLESARGPAVR